MRYHALRAAATIRKISLCIGCLAGSYVAAALINASPVIQPAIKSSPRIIVVAPPATSDEAAVSAEFPTARPESELAPNPSSTNRL